MAEMVGSALVQEAVSRGVSFGFSRREEKASQGHLTERLEMAVSELELALERSAKLPITDVSLLGRRKMIKRAYVEATALLHNHKQQAAVPAEASQEQIPRQRVKRKRWFICAKNLLRQAPSSSAAALNTDDVRRFEWFADRAGRFLRDLESGRSLHHYTFCNPMVRHLLDGKTLEYYELAEQGNRLRSLQIWPTCSEERGVEAVLEYCYEADSSTAAEKSFYLLLVLRLSESTDIVQVATAGLRSLTSRFKLAAESAIGELTLLPKLQDIAHSYYVTPSVGNGVRDREWRTKQTQHCRPDPACCRANRHGLRADDNSSSSCCVSSDSELADMFPEQVIFLGLHCYTSALEVPTSPRRSTCTNLAAVTVGFMPHRGDERLQRLRQDSYAIETMGDVKQYRDASIQQVAETLRSDAVSCFVRRPELTKYEIDCYSKHGGASFRVEKLDTGSREGDHRTPSPARRKRNMGSGASPLFVTCRWVLQLAHDRPRS